MRNTQEIADNIKNTVERLGSWSELSRRCKINQGQLTRYASLTTKEITQDVAERLLPAIGMSLSATGGSATHPDTPSDGMNIADQDKGFIAEYMTLPPDKQKEIQEHCRKLFINAMFGKKTAS
jgi:hypothetical protein